MRKGAVVLLSVVALAAACGGGDLEPVGSRTPVDSVAPMAGEWVTVLERTMANKRPTPEAFVSRSDSIRVITTMGALLSPYSPGLVITNILSDRSAFPMATIRAEQNRADAETVDTAVVEVGAGGLEFFVPEYYGLTTWSVEVQELDRAD